MTDELIEQIKDRDYFYHKAKASGDEDDWNIAKHLRNLTNANIRGSKREFILEQLKNNEDNSKKFWKVIRKVVPSKQSSNQDITLRDNGQKLEKSHVADYIKGKCAILDLELKISLYLNMEDMHTYNSKMQ